MCVGGRGHQECICCICFVLNILYIFIQIFMRCDAEGNCYDYWPYIWKHGLFYGRSSGDRVVKHQCRPLKYKVYHVFYDRFVMKKTIWLTKIEIYSFPEHFMLNFCYIIYHISGTILDSEGFPPKLRNPDLRWQMQHDQLLAKAWKDKKMVNI